jgi:hypothetical protein
METVFYILLIAFCIVTPIWVTIYNIRALWHPWAMLEKRGKRCVFTLVTLTAGAGLSWLWALFAGVTDTPWYEPVIIDGLSDEVRLAMRQAADMLVAAGARIVETDLPNMASAIAAYYVLGPCEAFSNLARYDGVRFVMDWAIQLNYYRILLEQAGFPVKRMFIQAMCRDCNLRTAAERGITKPVYIIPIHKISDCWIQRYFQHKAKLLAAAIESKRMPPVCTAKERWGDVKCLSYCDGRENCPYGQQLRLEQESKAG